MFNLSIQKDQFTWHKDRKVFIALVSDTRLGRHEDIFKPFYLRNDDTGRYMVFTPSHIDWSGCDEDREIGGWNFTNHLTDIRVLIIND